ncbi:MAG TPA: ATP-dependent metallopeptidase FtsH/Yme1/Tma family protein, partial [Gammaproteobacteria bacterium]|nr:ATP-dependent metallopeptidase FtsH/Yme1/Tma family protein [Gammaproteobacteria bacterium]
MAQSNQEGGSQQGTSGGGLPPGGQWRYWIWFLVLGLMFGYFLWMGGGQSGPQAQISYTQFKQEVRAGTVAEVTVRGPQIDGRFK